MNEFPDYLKSFPREEYEAHIKKLQEEMEAEGLDMLLLSSPENIFYSTAYRSWYTSSLFRPVLVFLELFTMLALLRSEFWSSNRNW